MQSQEKSDVDDIIKNLKKYKNDYKQDELMSRNRYSKKSNNFIIKKNIIDRAVSNLRSHSKKYSFNEINKSGLNIQNLNKNCQSSIREQKHPYDIIVKNHSSYRFQIYPCDSNASKIDKISIRTQKIVPELELNTSQCKESHNDKNYLINSLNSQLITNIKNSNKSKQVLATNDSFQKTTKSSVKTITKGSLKVRQNEPNSWVKDNIPVLVELENV